MDETNTPNSGSASLPGLLAGLSDIRAGWVIETKSRLGAE